MPTNIVITNAGRAALVNAQNTGTLPVLITQVGLSQTAVSPAATATSLPGEFKRVSGIGGEAIAPDTIHINMSDTTADVYSLRSFALYLADGTLFGIYGQAAPMLEKVAASDALLAIDVVFADISAASLSFGNTNYLNPPATTERQGVVELATVAEAQAGIDALRALTPSSAKAAILGWLLAQDGSGSGLDADMLDGLHAAAFARLTGAAFSGDLSVVGSGGAYAAMNTNGDVTSNRAGGATGVYYFTSSGTRYLYFNGAGFDLVGGQLAVNSAIVWNLANDGSGSGLDADYIDGLDSSQLVVVGPGTSRQGDVTLARATSSNDAFGGLELREAGLVGPAQSAASYAPGVSFHWRDRAAARFYMNAIGQFVLGGQTDIANNRRDLLAANVFSNGNLCWSAGNDGAGSGLDADLLDGIDSTGFVQTAGTGIKTMNGILRVTGGGGRADVRNNGDIVAARGDGTGVVFLNTGEDRYLHWNGTDYILGGVGAGLQVNGVRVWTPNNDGSGSGLDADLLDGFHATGFRRIVQRNPAENGGFYVYDDGIIEAWGYIDIYPNSGAVFTLPVQHQAWVIPTMSRLQSRYGDTLNTENIYLTSIDVDGSGRPVSLTIWNSDNFTNRVFIQTKGY